MSTTMKWGLITGMVYVIFSLISNMLGLQEAGGFSLTGLLSNGAILVVTFGTIYMGIKEYRDTELNGYLSFGQGFKSGITIAFIAALIACVFTFIYLTVIDPGFIDKIMAMTEEQWEKQGLSEEQMDGARKLTDIFMTPWAFTLITIISVVVWGLIKSLVAASLLKNEAPPTLPTE